VKNKKDRMTRKGKKNETERNSFINYAFVDDDCSSLASSKDDDDEGVRIIFDRSLLVVVGGSFDLKILYPIPVVGLGKRTGSGRRATLVKYGEKFVF